MLRYFLWMGRLSGRAQWMIILGGYFGYQGLRKVAASNPTLSPWVTPLLIAYIVFALMSWISCRCSTCSSGCTPSASTRCPRSRRRRRTGWELHSAGAGLSRGLAGIRAKDASFGAICFGLLLLPLTCVFRCPKGWPRKLMAGYTAVLICTLAPFVVADAFRIRYPSTLAPLVWNFFSWGCFLSGFIGNGLMQVVPRR